MKWVFVGKDLLESKNDFELIDESDEKIFVSLRLTNKSNCSTSISLGKFISCESNRQSNTKINSFAFLEDPTDQLLSLVFQSVLSLLLSILVSSMINEMLIDFEDEQFFFVIALLSICWNRFAFPLCYFDWSLIERMAIKDAMWSSAIGDWGWFYYLHDTDSIDWKNWISIERSPSSQFIPLTQQEFNRQFLHSINQLMISVPSTTIDRTSVFRDYSINLFVIDNVSHRIRVLLDSSIFVEILFESFRVEILLWCGKTLLSLELIFLVNGFEVFSLLANSSFEWRNACSSGQLSDRWEKYSGPVAYPGFFEDWANH